MIYLDNAATTPMFDCAIKTMENVIENEFGNPSTIYDIGLRSREIIENSRETIANIINAKPSEIYFTSGGSEGNSTVIKGCGARHIITDTAEHDSVINACENAHTWVTTIDVNSNGIVNADQLNFWNDAMTDLVSVMLVNNETGAINPIKELNKLKKKAKFHTDAVQAVGHMPIDVKDLGVDYLTASAHKFGGPKGVGFIYIRDGVSSSISPLINGGSQENDLRAGTENTAGIAAMASALQYCKDNKYFTDKVSSLSDLLLDRIKDVVVLNVGGNKRLKSTLSLRMLSVSGEKMMMALNESGIYISTGSACASEENEPSHVLKAIGLSDEEADCTIRVSIGAQNTVDDIEEFAKSLLYYYSRLKG